MYTMIYNINISSEEMAEILKIKNRNYISELVADHAFPKTDYNKYPLIAFIQRWIEYQEELHQLEIKRIKERDAKNRLDNVNAELKEIDLAIKRSILIPANQLEDTLETQAAIYVKNLEALKTKIPNLLNLNKQQKEVLETELIRIKEQIGNLPADISAAAVSFK
ncbi:MAG: hypothetical protein A2315_08020 [Ignavibacteria bacterium RIFOXYB2_FULL_35_12]|nr:MAG: hypothetical protein A2058_13660 [Ignavibacteria bacterium GWA2_36_19]OGU61180.1 MAG: hypothetical protein A2X60_15285 [Ignavibacteria bacterium GWF2_35_20]OGU81642.1 MAG: hypothetical protein A2254_12090 [Ignavibacteria bacterium RIFOXYA2_FULL_35_9]OGU89172.1 MAG: hypothetical protein A2492_00215 [Ignavibacteria bacterium RIFOXYC12_FULL_35_11]OGU94381.1 MAG: hypothetical protein A2347_12760 [Ignavibacteria bacterium RIFOXYB12_FULL_35_14]OGV04735.1 MAG: hypothetical protein A2315_08020